MNQSNQTNEHVHGGHQSTWLL